MRPGPVGNGGGSTPGTPSSPSGQPTLAASFTVESPTLINVIAPTTVAASVPTDQRGQERVGRTDTTAP